MKEHAGNKVLLLLRTATIRAMQECAAKRNRSLTPDMRLP